VQSRKLKPIITKINALPLLSTKLEIRSPYMQYPARAISPTNEFFCKQMKRDDSPVQKKRKLNPKEKAVINVLNNLAQENQIVESTFLFTPIKDLLNK